MHSLPLRGRSRAAPFFSRWSEVRNARSDIPHHRNGNMRKMKARHGKNLVQPLTRQTVCSALDRPPREYADMRPSVPGSLASNGQDSGIRCQSCQATGQDIPAGRRGLRSEEHTSELQSLMRITYAVFCLKKKTIQNTRTPSTREEPA